MPVNEYSKADYLRALLNSRKQLIGQGGSMLNPSLPDGISGLAQLDTSFNGVQPQAQPQPQQSKTSGENWFDGFMNNVLGFVDEIAAKFGAGFVNGWEGILDLGATAIGALGDATGWYNSQPFTDWAKQDIGATAAEWSKTAFGLGSWYNRIRNWDWDTEEWKDIGKGFLDLSQAAFFAKNDLGDAREISNKHYKANDEALQDMGGFGEFLGGVAHSIGFMLPSIMTGGAAAGASGAAAGTTAAQAAAKIGSLASLGLSAAGQGSQEALNEGASAGQALGYGAVSGAIEVASEVVVGKVLKGIGLGTNKVLGVFGGNTSKTLSKTASKELTKNIIKTAFEEGTEEVFSALLEPVAKSIYKGTDAFKDSNGKFIYASMEYWVGAGGDFNQSVLGQFAAGAFTGGITGGISETKLYKSVGSEGYLTIKSYANMTEAAQKAVELEEKGKINSKEYKAAVEEWEKWRNDFTDRSEKLGKLSQSKLNEVAKLLGNPAALEEALKKDIQESKDTNVRKFIKDVAKEVNSTDGSDNLLGARMITTRKSFEELQRITGTNVKLEYTTKDSHYSSKNNTVYLNKDTLKTEGGKHLVHEYLGHAMAKALSPKAQAKIFEQINENKSNSRMIKEVQNEPKYKKYQTEEIIARYLGNTFEQENQGKGLFAQLANLNSLVGNKTLFDHIIDVFSGVKNYKINDPIFNEYTKAINQFLKATSKNAKAKKIYALAEKKKNGEKLTKEEREFYDKYKEVIDAVANSKEEMTENKYKISQKDADGNVLSDQQAEFFKDSKVRDENGNLVPVYHSSDAYGFTIFDESYNDKYDGETQHGFYFSDNENVAKTYSKNPNKYTVYLNLKNPLIVDAKESEWFNISTEESLVKKGTNILENSDKAMERFHDWYYKKNSKGFTVVDEKKAKMSQTELLKKYLSFFDDLNYKFTKKEDMITLNFGTMKTSKFLDELKGGSYVDGFYDWILSDVSNSFLIKKTTRQIAKEAYNDGYDGVIVRNVVDHGQYHNKGGNKPSNIYVVFNSNQIKNVDNRAPTENSDIRYSKELIAGKYTVGDNNKRLEVRKVAKGYEVVYPDDVVLDQEQSKKKGKDVYVGRTITEAEIDGKVVKFDTTKNIQAYLDDIKAKKVEYEKAKKTAPINKPTSIEIQSAPTETEMKKADETPIKKKYHIHDGASIFVRDGNDVLKYEIKRNKDTGFYKASIINESTAEITEKELSYKALQREIDSYTNVSKNREDVLPKKKVEDTKKKTVKKESKVAKNEKTSQKTKTKTTAETKDGKETKVDTKVKKSKTTAEKIVNADVEVLSSEKVEIVKSDIVDEAPRRTAQDIKNEAELNNVRTYTKVEVENTVKNISTEILKMYKLFDTSAKVKYNSDGFAKVSQRVFELLNKKNVTPQEVASELENIFSNVKIESQNGKTLVTEDLSTLLGEDLMKNVDVTSIVRANLEELIKSGKEAKVHALKRIFKEVRKALNSQISSLRKTGDRLAVLVRRRDSLRRSVGRFAEITKREVSKSGFNVLLDPFEKLHRRGIKFNTTDFVDSLDKVLDIYEQQKWEADFPDLPFSEEIRERLVRLREQTKGGTLSGAVLMQDCLDTINLIKETMKKVETRYVTETIPASLSTIKSIERSRYGQSANVLSRFWRMYKRGFAPAYVVLEQVLGGNSSASKKLVYDMQNAINKRTLYKGVYADKINIELKKLGIKKTFDTKKIFFRGHNLTVDQAMGLYISTHVKANFDAINEDGASFYDETHDRVIELAQKGDADVLRFETETYLPEEYRKFADWLLTTMNGTVKAEYIDWFEKKYGSYQMRNEIGAIGNNSYWSLKRSYQKLNNISKAVSNPDAVFSHAIKRTSGGHNAVLITGALGTFNAYIDKLSREIYTKPVYEETLAILNAKVDGNNSVMDVLSKREGSGKDIQFLKETMASLLDVNQRKYSLLDQMVSAFSVAKLSLNIGSMAKQFASAFTSNIPISKTAKALVARWSNEARSEYKTLVDQLGGLKYREASKGVMKANADSVGKFTEKIAKVGMWGISKVDLFTVSTGVYSLMVIGQDQFGAKIGTQKNIDFVKQHWSEYELSQIGNGALSRNAVANSSDSLVRYLFGFLQGANRAALGSQIHKFGLWQRNRKVDIKVLETELARAEQRLKKAETAYNANQDDVNARNEYVEAKADVVDLQNRKSDYESYKIAGGKAIIPNMAAGLVAQGILVALVNSLMKRIKGKKDWDEIDVAEEGLNFAMALGVNWVPLVNQVASVLQGYDVTVPPVEIINKISEIASGINNNNWKTAARQIAILVGDLTGVPVETVYSYIYGALKTFDPAIAYEMRNVLYGTSVQSATKTMQTYAAKGNETKTASMVGLILNKYKTGSTTDEINKELARLYISGYSALPKTALSQYTNESGDVVKLTSAQIQQFNQIYSRSTKDVSNLLKITEYSSATSEEKAKAIKKIYDAYYAVAKAKVTGGQVEGKIAQILALTNGNIGLAKYILSLQKIAQIGETAKKTRKELVLQYINRLRGYTRAEKTLLMFLAGYSVSGTSASQLKGFLISKGASSKDLKQYL